MIIYCKLFSYVFNLWQSRVPSIPVWLTRKGAVRPSSQVELLFISKWQVFQVAKALIAQ